MIRKCAICGAEFKCPPSSEKYTCSAECSSKLRSRSHKGHTVSAETRVKMSKSARKEIYSVNCKNGTLAAQQSEKGGRNVNNSSAKSFILRSPDAQIYKVRNLRQFIRDNPQLFYCDGSDKAVNRISHGFYTIKKNMKRNKSGQNYYGWTIIDFDDRKNCEK